MGKIKFNTDSSDIIEGGPAGGEGKTVKTDRVEITKIAYPEGGGMERHTHETEQLMYVLSGKLRVTMDDQEYELNAGEATFSPSNVPHSVYAVEDSVCFSVKS